MKYILPICFFLVGSNYLSAQTGKLEYLDVYNLEYVSEPQIAPDGQKILYVRNFKDVMTDESHSNLWMINFDGSENRPLTTGNQNDFSPRWSPDGSKILYKSNRGGSVQLYLRWLDNGAETKLTNQPQSPGSFVWRPDGQYILFSRFVPEKPETFAVMPTKPAGAQWNDPPKYIDDLNYRSDGSGYLKQGHVQLFTLSVDGGTPRQITFEENDHHGFDWSRDGERVFFTANLHEDHEYEPLNTEIYAVDLQTLEVMPITGRYGPDRNPVVSPDGSRVAYLGNDDRYKGYQPARLYLMNTDGSNSRELDINLDRSVRNITWDGPGKGLYCLFDDEGNTKIGYYSLEGKMREVAENVGGTTLGRPYASGGYSVSRNGRLAYTYTTPTHPADLMVIDEKGRSKRLTFLNDDLFNYKKPGEVEEIWFESSYDQRKIQGWICKPPDFDAGKNAV